MRMILLFATVAVAVFCANVSQAVVTVNWGTPQNISGDSDVITDGTLVYAYNYGVANIATSATVNGVTFAGAGFPRASEQQPSITLGSVDFFENSGFLVPFNALGTGSGAFNSLSASYKDLLSSGGGAIPVGTLSATLNGLTVGNEYKFQWWLNNSSMATLLGGSFLSTSATAGNAVTLDANVGDQMGNLGQYVVGSFVAAAPSIVIQFNGENGNNPLINALQVRDITAVPEPSTYAMALAGIACSGFSMWRRRKRGRCGLVAGPANVLRAACLAVVAASAAVAPAADIIISTGSTASVPTDYASGTYGAVTLSNTSTLNVNALLTATSGNVLSASLLNVNADVTVTEGLLVDGAALSLTSGTLGVGGRGITLNNSAVFQRTSGNYATNGFEVQSGSASFVAGDSIANYLALVDSSFTLSSNLTLPGRQWQDEINVSGSTSVVNRTNGAVITSGGVAVRSSASFTILPGDNFTDSYMWVLSGGSLTNTGSQSPNWIEVDGAGTVFTTTAPLTVLGTNFFIDDSIAVYDGGTFNANAAVNARTVSVTTGGVYNLASGTLTATSLVVDSGSVSRGAGAAYDVGSLSLTNATMNFLPSDSVGSLTLTGTSLFTTGTSLAALEVASLSITLSQLALGNFDGTDGQVSAWGLKVGGNVQSTLLGYIGGGQITSVGGVPMTAIYDATANASYVIPVPEPVTCALALAGLACGGFSMWRRRRRA